MHKINRSAGVWVIALALALLPQSAGAVTHHMCGGKRATILGSAGDDTLTGTRHQDVIVSLSGDDTITGRGGKDIICAGAGKDTVKGNGGADRIAASNLGNRVWIRDTSSGYPGDSLGQLWPANISVSTPIES